LQGGVDLGISSVEYDDGSLDSEVFPYVSIDGRVSPSPSTRITGRVGHGVRDSDVYPFASQEYTEFKGSVEVDASASVTVGLNATYRLSEYDEDALPAAGVGLAAATSGDEDTIVVQAEASLKVADNARVKATYRVEDVESDVETSYTKNTGILGVYVDI